MEVAFRVQQETDVKILRKMLKNDKGATAIEYA
jgi:hypothetical protein